MKRVDRLLLLCEKFGLGGPLFEPVVLTGGLLHEMWYLVTSRGEFALKCINSENVGLLADTLLPVAQAEALAAHFEGADVSTRSALLCGDEFVFVDDEAREWMVFPWVPGELVDTISPTHATKVGQLLGEIHQKTYCIDELPTPPWFGFESGHWRTLFDQALDQEQSWADLRSDGLGCLHKWSDAARQAAPILQKNVIVSHRDLSPTNIIWHEGNPTIIDWEYAGYIHPEQELFNTATLWSLTENSTDPVLFNNVLCGYQASPSSDSFTLSLNTLTAGFAGYLMEWLEFNMQRALRQTHAKDTAISEISNTLSLLFRLERQRS